MQVLWFLAYKILLM